MTKRTFHVPFSFVDYECISTRYPITIADDLHTFDCPKHFKPPPQVGVCGVFWLKRQQGSRPSGSRTCQHGTIGGVLPFVSVEAEHPTRPTYLGRRKRGRKGTNQTGYEERPVWITNSFSIICGLICKVTCYHEHPVSTLSRKCVHVLAAILNSSSLRFFFSSLRICRLISSARVNWPSSSGPLGTAPGSSSSASFLPWSISPASFCSRMLARSCATPETAFLRTTLISLSTGRAYGSGGRGWKSFSRLGGSIC